MPNPSKLIDELEKYALGAMPGYPNDICSRAKKEIIRLRSIIRVNGLRAGHNHAEIDAMLDKSE